MRVLLVLDGSTAAIAAFLATVPETLTASSNEDFPAFATAPVQALPAAPVTISAAGSIPAMPNLSNADDSDDDSSVNGDAPATDKNGLPWDERIHAKSKAINADGTWRRRKGVQDATVAAIEAELRGVAPVAIPTGMPMTAPIPMPSAPAPAPVAMPAPVPAPAVMPVAAPIPVMPTAAPAPIPAAPVAVPMPEPVAAPVAAPAADTDFAGFMAHLTTKMQGGVITAADLEAKVQQINAAWTPHGHAAIGAITDLASDPQKLSYAIQLLQADGKW